MLANEEEAVREWLVEAEKLVESFRETRALFLTSRVRLSSRAAANHTVLIAYSIVGSGGCSLGAPGNRLQKRRRTAWHLACSWNSVCPSNQYSVYRSDDMPSGRDALARKAAKSENVNTFRTILFEDWLRLFMHVEFCLPSGDDRLADCL